MENKFVTLSPNIKQIILLAVSVFLVVFIIYNLSVYSPFTQVSDQQASSVTIVDPLSSQDEYWTQWVQDQLSKLEASGKIFDRDELTAVMLEEQIIDTDGNYDFEAGYRALERKFTQ